MKISIIIITKDRAKMLEACLRSLSGQLGADDETVVIMDTSTTDGTEGVLLNNARSLHIKYFKSKIQGFSYNYNLAIKKCSGRVLVFINDDSIVSQDFVRNIKKAHLLHRNSVIQGMTYSLPKKNIYAEIMGDNYQNWVTLNTLSVSPPMLKTIDSKNVSMPKEIFIRFGVFSDRFGKGAEDRAYGLMLYKARVPIYLDSSIVTHHNERTTLKGFVQQHVRIGYSESIVDRSLEKDVKIKMITVKKTLLHMQSAVAREDEYLRDFRLIDCILLPFLYILLGCVRVYSYVFKPLYNNV
jgi:glycosyltransferase involved in cell wall biosynthesis